MGHVAQMGAEKCIQSFNRKIGKKEKWEDQGIDRKIIFTWLLNTVGEGVWGGFICLRIVTGIGGLLRIWQ